MTLAKHAHPKKRASATLWQAAVLTLVVLALGWLSSRDIPVHGPREVTVEMGETVEYGGMQLRVEEAWQTGEVAIGSMGLYEDTFTTSGTFLVVRIAYQPLQVPASVGWVFWRDAQGRVFTPDTRAGARLGTTQPGQWWTEDIVFEVPPDAVGDGELLAYLASPTLTTDRPGPVGTVQVPADAVQSVARHDALVGGWQEGTG